MKINQKAMSELKIALIGDPIQDHYVYGTIKRNNPEAPAPLITVDMESWSVGGSYNVLQCMVKLGVVVDYYTTNAVLPIKTRVIVDNRQIVRYDNEEEKRSIYREESDFILKDIGHKHPDAIIISDYAKGCVGPWIKDLPTKMVYIDAHPKNYHLYPKDTHLKMNHKELQEITGFSDILTGIDIIKKDHATIVITQGARGAFYLDNCRPVESVPSHKRQVSDVTGAGDAFMAAYVPALLITGNMAEAIKFANSYAGLSVEKTGSYHPSWKEIESGRTDD